GQRLFQKLRKAAAACWAEDETHADCKDGQDHQRDRHERRRLVGFALPWSLMGLDIWMGVSRVIMSAGITMPMAVLPRLGRYPQLTPERHEIGPESIKPGQPRGNQADNQQHKINGLVARGGVAGVKSCIENLVLAPESGQQREATQGQGSAQKRPVRVWQ